MRRVGAAAAAIVTSLVLGGSTVTSQEASGAPAGGATATASPATTPSMVLTANLAYESADAAWDPGVLDVYAPAGAGPWPVVVMFHGFQGSKWDLAEHARRVAELGFVVFSAAWSEDAPSGQGSCAVAFAQAHAEEYGGDPAATIVFGHSGGAHTGAMVAFARPEPTAGCLGRPTLGSIDALVTWEGSWIGSVPPEIWDPILEADPGFLDQITPWRYLAEHQDLRVVMLVSESPGRELEREVGDPWAADSWLAVRDPSGDLRRQLEANGAFADGVLDFVEIQELLYSVLAAQGSPVSLDVMPGSTHTYLSEAGWEVFLAAFPKAAAAD
jgi:acetyl esterase/lipase